MTAGELTDVRSAATALVSGLLDRPWGQVCASVYETGRVLTLAPWLTGHTRRVEYLLSTQRPDGGWGAPGGYALVPTLSATEAMLTAIERGDGPRPGLARAADRGLRTLFAQLRGLDAAALPDTPAADLIAVALIGAVNRHLDRFPGDGPPPGLDRWSDGARLSPPAGLDRGRNAAIEAALVAGARPPDKLLHALEVAGTAARGARTVQPGPSGTVGASPAATAAWLDHTGPDGPASAGSAGRARRYLEAAVAAHAGPVPCGYPITVFERAWVLTTLARAGLAPPVPAELIDSLRPALAPGGTPAGEGLPADADTTSVALYALGLCGVPYRPDPLWTYRTDTHFCTWPGEDGFSVTTNAHVLEAIGHYAERPGAEPRYGAAAAVLAALLRAHQCADGTWNDRWHASPYYATACCALALHRFGGPASRAAVAAATQWLLAAQRADGSWGRWSGTAEETAYALQVLALTRAFTHATPPGPGTGQPIEAIARGRAYLLGARADEDAEEDAPALWHDKDLYRPAAIVGAAVLAALHSTADAQMTVDTQGHR